jgi:hypothetical protein
MSETPDWLVSMVRREPPIKDVVVNGSTPVVSFGDFRHVRVATLGINPSNLEFVDAKGNLLQEEKRRLATLPSLESESLGSLTDSQVEIVIDESNRYFDVNPYRWFKKLDEVIKPGLGVSYFDGSLCHLDLCQWATEKKWGKLDTRTRNILLEDGLPHLRNQLTKSNISLVVVNGKSGWDHVKKSGMGTPKVIDIKNYGAKKTSCKMLEMIFENVRFVGWTANIQTPYGAGSKIFLAELATWLSTHIDMDDHS